MAVLGRLLVSSAERLDLPDVLSIDSYAAGDWQYFMQGLVGTTTPYILKGFDVANPQSAIGTQSCSINVADSAVFYPGSSAGPFYFGLPAGNALSAPLVPELRKNATNYVYLTLSTTNTSQDTRAFWDPDQNGGTGGEFTQDVNTESVLSVQVNVSTGSFPANTIPVAIIIVGAVVITSIEDARSMLFRLGSGGISPNPYNKFQWPALPTSNFEREEPAIIMTSSSAPNPFQGGDKNLTSLKDWMDAVMSKLQELGGTKYWYEDTSTYSLVSIFIDALASNIVSKGVWQHSPSLPGELTWTEDVLIQSTEDLRTYILRAGNVTLSNEQVAYLPLVRGAKINATDSAVAWTNGQSYVNTVGGSIGFFTNLSQGDWIKKASDGNDKWLRVEAFFDTVNLGGSITTAGNAKSIALSGAYQGSTANDIAEYDKGVYQSSDVVISSRNAAAIQQVGGNFHWVALRRDIIEDVSDIVTTTVSGTVSSASGSVAEINATAHGLINNDYITVTAPAGMAGTYQVDVVDADNFTFPTTNTSTGAFTGHYAVVTTAARTTQYGFQLESANHCFSSGDTVIIAGTTNYNGSYPVNVVDATHFNIAVPSALATETAGTATLAVLEVRSEGGAVQIIQGEIVDIDSGLASNIKLFLGMTSNSQTHPTYAIPSNYDTLVGQENFNALATDDVTDRLSKLTAMMADKAQDKMIQPLVVTSNSVLNMTSGANQQLTFVPAAGSLVFNKPGSAGNSTLNLPFTAPGIQLAVNQCAYVDLNRNATETLSIQITSITDTSLIDENKFIIATRLTDTVCYLWNETPAKLGNTPINGGGGGGLAKVTLYDPVDTILPTGASVIIDGSSVNNLDLVLFSNLATGNNEVYQATVVGGSITAWTAQFEFSGNVAPSAGDTVIITEGTNFANQIGEFDGTNWDFNAKVRYFNGSDYWEQSNLNSIVCADNQTSPAPVFAINYPNSENIIVDFSITRGALKETGTAYMTTDGTNVSVTSNSTEITPTGVQFSGDINAGHIRLLYTSSNLGEAGIIKFIVRRWADGSGGPAGIPSYSTGSTTVGVTGTGAATQIATWTNGTNISGNANFTVDTVNKTLNLGSGSDIVQFTALSEDDISLSAPASNQPLFSYPTTYTFAIVDYSAIVNGSNYRIGTLLITQDGVSNVNVVDTYSEIGSTGLILGSPTVSHTISGGNVNIAFTSLLSSIDMVFKWSVKRWF